MKPLNRMQSNFHLLGKCLKSCPQEKRKLISYESDNLQQHDTPSTIKVMFANKQIDKINKLFWILTVKFTFDNEKHKNSI